MSADRAERVVQDYLSLLSRELQGLPRADRDELLQQLGDHIAQARSETDPWDEAAALTLLDRLGSPAEIAAEARDRLDIVPPGRPGGLDAFAVVLLLLGGLVIPLVGWLAGVVLLWSSAAWTRREKLLGTFVIPGGLATPMMLLLVAGVSAGRTCATSDAIGDGKPATTVCTGGASQLHEILAAALLIICVVAPLVTTAVLASRLQRRRALSATPAG